MLLQISTTHHPATDLGYLLHKHPDKLQSFKLSHGQAHVFYPEASPDKTTACLLLDIDPIDLVRGVRHLGGKGFTLGQYVNDRPYVASSFMSVALSKAFSTAMNGRCSGKPELAEVELPFEVKVSVVAAPKGGEVLIRKMFEPLGYEVALQKHVLDPKFEEWGDSKYFNLQLKNTLKTKDLLSHLYVLLPALDNDKHYYISENEIDKLLQKGKGWLESHPEKEQIISRYLLNLRSLSRMALEALNKEGDLEDELQEVEVKPEIRKRKETLHSKRLKAVCEKLVESGAKTVVDLGCGEGKLLRLLLKKKQFAKITGMDISFSELQKAKEKLHWEDMAPKQKERLELFQGALTYRDKRLDGYDAAALVEVIEHLEEDRLAALERVIFEFSKPKTVVVTTPNQEFNQLFEGMETGEMRHDDHRFEWTRAEFEAWGNRVASDFAYTVTYFPIGEVEEKVGAPSQMAVFEELK
ncbi:MAG: 3' terminal RNA ribose 2'-O-methyltransferase Hen1 [Chitinophagales bacterium]